jgi:hypothetical protein
LAERIASYRAFWPYYLAAHSRTATRALHYAATVLFIAVAVAGVLSGRYWVVALAPIPAYALAWLSHFCIERNKPATFAYPLWSLVSDFRMFALALTGRLNREIEKYRPPG